MSQMNVKKLYMREHSNVIRKWSSRQGVDGMHENSILHVEGVQRTILVTICRIRQRVLTQAWQMWVKNADVQHDYEADARTILTRKIPIDELRSELEIEVLYKWVLQAKDIDPTGVATTIFMSKKKSAKYAALQQLRLEFYHPGETVLFQGDIPRPEDGHFTILRGECEVLQFPDESVPLSKLQYLAKKRRWDDAKKLIRAAQLVATIPKYSGFGELSTLTGVKRAASIRASEKISMGKPEGLELQTVEILVLPKSALMDCLKSRVEDDTSANEAIDFLRQSGLANRISPKDLVQAARSMDRRTLLQGDILYYKGEPSHSMYLVVSGEFLLDIGEFMLDGEPMPFVANTADKCYYLSVGSLLGDEGVLGEEKVFSSTAIVVSTAAVVFEATGFALSFLAEKLKSLRYCAIYYKDQLRWDNPNPLVEQVNPYTYFNSLRRTIAFTSPFRGVMSIAEESLAHLKERRLVHSANKKAKAANANKGWSKMDFEEEEKLTKSRTKKAKQMDSRASFLMSSSLRVDHQHSLVSENDYASFPRVLSAIGLHRAIEINKAAKKSLQNSMKAHAKESILYEQLRKIPEEEGKNKEKAEALKTFKKCLRDYYKREDEFARLVREEEERRKAAPSRASAAIRFFTSNFAEEEEEEKEQEPMRITIRNLSEEEEEAEASLERRLSSQDSSVKGSVGLLPSILESSESTFDIYGGERKLTKLEQYYEWMTSLNRAHYRDILAQARLTADLLNNQLHHDESLLKDTPANLTEVVGQLGDVFRSFGLTPQDLNIPWQFNAQVPALKRGGSLPLLPAEANPTPSPLSRTQQRRHAAVPLLDTTTVKKGGKAKSSMLVLKNTAAQTEEMVAKARLESQFKSYNPASWRDELIMKKAQELTGEAYRFMRAETPDNRRVLAVRVHVNYFIEVYQPEHMRGNTSNKGEKLLHATIKPKANSPSMEEVNFEHYIDNPDYFMQMLDERPIGSPNRKLPTVASWQTRFLVATENNQASSKPPVLDSVRTHLKEDLQDFSKDHLVNSVQQIKTLTHNRPLLKTWREEESRPLRRASTVSMLSEGCEMFDDAPARGRGEGTQQLVRDSLPSIVVAPKPLELPDAMKSPPASSSESVGIQRESAEASSPVLPQRPSSGSRRSSRVETTETNAVEINQNANDGIAPFVSETILDDGDGEKTTSAPASAPTITISVKEAVLPAEATLRRADTATPSELASQPSGRFYPPVKQRFSDSKEPSKALKMFEEVESKAALEGRKKANNTSKFRLLHSKQQQVEEVSLEEINRKRWKAEWTLFHAMFPNCTQKNQHAFIEAFRKKYPEATIRPDIRVVQPESITLNYPSATMDDFSVGEGSSLKNNTHSFDLAQIASQVSDSFSSMPEDPDLANWQQFTVDSILRTKDGERKTLPQVSVKKLNIQGKRYRSAYANKSFVPLVTLPAKKDEQPISGPTPYLQLYKNGFQVHLTAAERAKALEEVNQYRTRR
eukprot:gene9216-10177_t